MLITSTGCGVGYFCLFYFFLLFLWFPHITLKKKKRKKVLGCFEIFYLLSCPCLGCSCTSTASWSLIVCVKLLLKVTTAIDLMETIVFWPYILRGWKAHLQSSVAGWCGFSNLTKNAPLWVISKSEVSNMEPKKRTSTLLTLNILLGSLSVLFNYFYNNMCNDTFFPKLQQYFEG